MLERARVTRPSNERLRAEPSTRVWLHVGDIVYLTYDSGKHEIIRPRYVVASIEGQWCQVKKFTANCATDPTALRSPNALLYVESDPVTPVTML